MTDRHRPPPLSSGDPAFLDQVRRYIDPTRDRPPHPIYDLLDEYLPGEGDALDLGCGGGRGTMRLLERGFRVTAVDTSPYAVQTTRERAPSDASLTVVESDFLGFSLDTYDVVTAVYCLFFLPRADLEEFWKRLVDSIRPGGLFAGQFIGDRDSWNGTYTTLTRAEVDALLGPLEVIHFNEEEDPNGATALGEPKHWHIFHVIARKR
jgi:SAM-dependent methyltransferase